MTKRRHLHQTIEEGQKYFHEGKRVKLRFVFALFVVEEAGEAENINHDTRDSSGGGAISRNVPTDVGDEGRISCDSVG